jgi:mannose-1-phosphate guanylyltransferase
LIGVEACILAGGRGTRFMPYTDIIPKPMVPVGPDERPLLEHIVCWIKRYGLNSFVFLVNYRWRQIRNYFGSGEKLGVRIKYSVDEEPYGETGGSLLLAYRRGLLETDSILVWYGDILAPLDVRDLIRVFREKDPDALIVVTDRYKVPVGIAELRGDDIIRLEEKPWVNINATIGVLMLKTSILGEAGETLGTRFDIMGGLIPWMIKTGHRVKAYVYRGEWYDIGSLERYKKLDNNKIAEFLRT